MTTIKYKYQYQGLRKLLFDLIFIDQKEGTLSHTKVFSVVGYVCMSFAFVWAVMYGTSVDVMIWVLFGVVVVGNRTALKVLGRKEQQ